MAKISVVMPAYNAQTTLERAVSSILAQTHKNLEVLVVNNGSSDRTGEIAERLAATDPRVRVFSVNPNIGGYGARLYAWKRASGDFLATVDADDWIEPEMYERMLAVMENNSLDVVECDWTDGMASEEAHDFAVQICSTREEVYGKIVFPTFLSVGKSAYVWNKLYRNQYEFDKWEEGDFGSYEDLIHNLQLFAPVAKFGHISAAMYHYMPSDSSVTRNFSVSRLKQFSNAIQAKKRLAQAYGVAQDDPIIERWVLNDAINVIVSAAKYNTDLAKIEIYEALFAMPEVRDAMKSLHCGNDRSMLFRLMSVASRLPAWALLALVKVALRFWPRR